MTFVSVDGPVLAHAKLVWIKKRGWRRFELGVQFVDVTETLRAALCATARAISASEVIKPTIDEFRNRAA